MAATKTPSNTPSTEDVKEHERLVDVLRSPSHADDKAEAKKQAAELADMKREVGITVSSKTKVRDPMSGTETHVTLSNGKTHRLQRLNSTESMGLPGWHDLDGGFLDDTEDGAIKRLLDQHNNDAPAGEHDHLLADIPGAKWRRGKGLIAGHYGVEVDGEGIGNYHAKPEDAAAQAKQWLANRAAAKDEADKHSAAVGKLRDRLLSGGEPTDADLKLLGLKDGASGLKWFIPAAAKVFGITSHAVRPHIKDMIRIGHTDMGTKLEFVSPKKALQAIAAGLAQKPAAAEKVHDWADRESAPAGSWVKVDFKLADSQPVYQVRDLPLDGLYLPELDSSGRLQPEKRKYLDGYTERAKAGERAPSINVIEMESGKLRVVDGHRRVMAARAAGKTTIRALVSPLIDTPDGKKEATAELVAKMGARPAS